jgi:hypothetical protein
MVEDIDMDNDLELVASCWNQNVYVWDLSADRYYGFTEWNGFHGNIHNTGWKEYDGWMDASELTCSYRFVRGMIELSWFSVPDFTLWNLYRQRKGEEFEFLCADLRADETGVIRYVDRTAEEGVTYCYRLEAEGQPELAIETGEIEVPVFCARLYQNYPNPCNPQTVLPFTVPGASGARESVLLVVYDVRGVRLRTLVNGVLSGGRHEVQWDGRNDRGEFVASGIYFARLNVGGFKAARKMVLIR